MRPVSASEGLLLIALRGAIADRMPLELRCAPDY
jgi:hypothetical protein